MMWALVLWTAVAGSSGDRVMDWRVLTQHRTLELCHRAANDLGKTPNQYRCIRQENDLPLRNQ